MLQFVNCLLQGLYISLLETRHALLVILDTEGLLSVEARDDVFDKQVALMTMACSDLVIVNNRGELGRRRGAVAVRETQETSSLRKRAEIGHWKTDGLKIIYIYI